LRERSKPRAHCLENQRLGTIGNAEALARCNVRAVTRYPQRRGVVAADAGLIDGFAMTSLQLLILFAAVMLVLTVGAASVFI
jgi:hypothetical protein